jgi:hypothetical protein
MELSKSQVIFFEKVSSLNPISIAASLIEEVVLVTAVWFEKTQQLD